MDYNYHHYTYGRVGIGKRCFWDEGLEIRACSDLPLRSFSAPKPVKDVGI
jgi:hypothetical protein